MLRHCCLQIVLGALTAGCTAEPPRTDTSLTTASSTRTVVAGWESVSVRRDSIPAERPPPPTEDSAYNAFLSASIVPEEKAGPPLTLATTDETDMSNYQSAGWWLGINKNGSRPNSMRFLADFSRFTSGLLVLILDTTLVRNQTEAPFDTKRADSIAVPRLGKTERFSTDCKFGAHPLDERINGVVPDTTANKWMRPRLVWLFDTVSARIRRIKPDSISCMLMPDAD